MKKLLILTAVIALSAGVASAGVGLDGGLQNEEQKMLQLGSIDDAGANSLTNNAVGLKAPRLAGLLDAERFSIQHSVGMSYRSGNSSRMNQYYLGTITYKVAKPLTIQAQVGVANTMFGTPIGGPGASATQLIVPDVSVLYQPKDNLRIEFRFSQGSGYGPSYGWRDFEY